MGAHVHRLLIASAIAVCMAGAGVAGCSRQATGSHAAPPAPAASSAAPSPAPSPVVVRQGILTATCWPGIYDKAQNEFYTIGSLAQGSDMEQGDPVSEAYQLNLSDVSPSQAASVTGFTVAFYADGRRLTAVTQPLAVVGKVPAGQSASWTEYPWGSYPLGSSASAGPFAGGKDGAVNPAVTCQLVSWTG